MNKKITIAILTLLVVMTSAYGIIQKQETLYQKSIAEKGLQLAEAFQQAAKKQKIIAEQQMHSAQMHAFYANEQLVEAEEAFNKKSSAKQNK